MLKLAALLVLIGIGDVLHAQAENEPRSLYTYSFGGIEAMEVGDAVEMLDDLGYAGIAVEARGEKSLNRMSEFYKWSEQKGDDFEVVSAFMAHRFGKYGFSDAGHKAAINLLAGKDGTIWVWVRDDLKDGSIPVMASPDSASGSNAASASPSKPSA